MSKTPHADRKVEHASFHLGRLRAENAKMIGKNGLAIEADVSACLGAIKSALYRLKEEVGSHAYTTTLARWKGTMTPVERHRFKRMADLRDLDVHEGDIQTSVKQTAVPASAVPNVTASAPPGVLVPNSDPEGIPKYAVAWVFRQEVQLEAADAAATCEKYLELLKRFIAEFQKP
jgi:hypothetical protein